MRNLLAYLAIFFTFNSLYGCASSDTTSASHNKSDIPEIKIDLGSDNRRLGNPNAKIGIIEFYDFECSYCQLFHYQVLPQLKKKYIDNGDILYMVRDFPLKTHKNAYQAAVFANCAGKQGKYWGMQGRLLSHQNKLSPTFMFELADELELDKNQLKTCIYDQGNQQRVYRDFMAGRRLGVTGTPTFFLGTIENNILSVTGIAKGVPSFSELEKQIADLKN